MVQGVDTARRAPDLSRSQASAIRSAMRSFIDEDVASRGYTERRLYCDACQRSRPAPGFIRYCRYQICNACTTEYELARARGVSGSVGQFVRDRQFGETLDLLIDLDLHDPAGSHPSRRTG